MSKANQSFEAVHCLLTSVGKGGGDGGGKGEDESCTDGEEMQWKTQGTRSIYYSAKNTSMF